MSGECEKCSEHCTDCECDLQVKSRKNGLLMREVIQRIECIGRAQEKLDNLFGDEIFDNLSKHNPYWDSEHEIESEKLYDIRCKLGYIHDKLSDIVSLFYWENEGI